MKFFERTKISDAHGTYIQRRRPLTMLGVRAQIHL